MYPRALLADVCDLQHVRVQPRRGDRLSECRFVHARRAGADDDAGEVMRLDRILNEILSRFGTHVLIIGGKDDAGLVFQHFGDLLHVDGARNITAAPTNKNANSLHLPFPPYFLYFRNALTSACCGMLSVSRPGISFGVR